MTQSAIGVHRGLPRVPAVLLVLLFSLAVAAGEGWGVGTQVSKLANQIPEYANRVNIKIAVMVAEPAADAALVRSFWLRSCSLAGRICATTLSGCWLVVSFPAPFAYLSNWMNESDIFATDSA